jgi:hypothetical protein
VGNDDGDEFPREDAYFSSRCSVLWFDLSAVAMEDVMDDRVKSGEKRESEHSFRTCSKAAPLRDFYD